MADNEQRQVGVQKSVILADWGRSLREAWWELLEFERMGAKRLKGLAKQIIGTGDFASLYQQKQATGLNDYYGDYESRYTLGNYFKRQWLRFKGWWRNETAFYRYCKDREKYEKTCTDFSLPVPAPTTAEHQIQRVTRSDCRVFSRYLSRSITEATLSDIAVELEHVVVSKRSGLLKWLSKKLLDKHGVLGTLTSFFKSYRSTYSNAPPAVPVPPQRDGEETALAVRSTHVTESSSQDRYAQFSQLLPREGESLDVFKAKLDELDVCLEKFGYQKINWFAPNLSMYHMLAEALVNSLLGESERASKTKMTPEVKASRKRDGVLSLCIYESYRVCRTTLNMLRQPPKGEVSPESYVELLHCHFQQSLSLWWGGPLPGMEYHQYCYKMLSEYFQDALSKLPDVDDARRVAYENLFEQSLILNQSARANTQQLVALHRRMVEQNHELDQLRQEVVEWRKEIEEPLTVRQAAAVVSVAEEQGDRAAVASGQVAALTQMMQQLMAMNEQRSQPAQQQASGMLPSSVSVGSNPVSTFGGRDATVQQQAVSSAAQEGMQEQKPAAIATPQRP